MEARNKSIANHKREIEAVRFRRICGQLRNLWIGRAENGGQGGFFCKGQQRCAYNTNDCPIRGRPSKTSWLMNCCRPDSYSAAFLTRACMQKARGDTALLFWHLMCTS